MKYFSSENIPIYSILLAWNDIHVMTVDHMDDGATEDDATAAFTLLLPGKTLYLSKLLALKKFRNKGNKDGAVRAF